ncbi:SusC/RagA family TonB-linked outer membrane protein [Pedobacter sp. HMWF019]|uniref:SusC/RagA family TonB-linked outer membrane protein n=1 Tax=Pedobacter sp. HMWF019 TaxID=2056856 RepID=UPI000D391BD9|nr:TonB-dependent receptor [Pedobacter sp. HMWF019]PTS98288.1 SusC/RagA family TonB-linked outer membrane protein [Pedobacter sp. HMWF019]
MKKRRLPKELWWPVSRKYLVMVPLLACLSHAEAFAGPLVTRVEWKPTAQKNVKGIVKDEEGMPLPGVSILEKGTKNGASTNGQGEFSITLKNPNAILIVSSIGFLPQEVPVKGGTLNIVLKGDKKALDEVVVVGYGTQKKANLTGAVSQIDSKMLENRPTANLGQALQGLMPNFNVSISNGSPNTGATYNVRGGTSFFKDANDGNKIKFQSGAPFILVDGVEMDPNLLNPEDIESVTLLKDAASAAIYGARGAFGVMLIKTKSGKGGKSRVTYSNSFQWNTPTAVPDILDAYSIQEAIVKAAALENGSAGSNEILKLQKIKEYMDDPLHNEPYYFEANDVQKNNIIWRGNVNPYKEALSNYSPMQKHNLSLSGGSDNVSYYGSFGYQNEDGLYKINTDNFKRYNALLNVSAKINNWFKIDFKTAYNNSTYIEPVSPSGKGGWWVAMSQEPSRNVSMPMLVPASLNVKPKYTDNILSFMDYGSSDQTNKSNILLSASPSLQFTKEWSLKSDLSYLANSTIEKTILPTLERLETTRNATTTVQTNPDYIKRYNFNSNKYTVNIYTDYIKTIAGKHNFHGLIGFNREWYTDQDVTAQRNNINVNVPTISQAQGLQTVGDSESHWAVQGLFYRLTYNYDGKYLFESNGRYDGTSKFPSDTRFKFFPSFSAGWRVSEEQFAKSIKPYINDLKLRASYGSLGNQNVKNYLYISNYGTDAQIQYLLNGVRPVGVTAPGLIDPNLTWETATTIDFGADLTVFKNFEISFDWYNRRTTDILTDGLKYPAVLGASSPQVNSGTIDTKGWELILKYRNATNFGLNYDLAFTLGDYQSKVVKFDNNPNKIISDSNLYEGQKMGEIWGYETYGIFQSQDEINKAPSQKLISSGLWYPGDVRYKDIDGDNQITFGNNTVGNSGDRKIIGNSTPRYQYGLNSNFNYKGFDLNIFFQGVGKRDLWIGNNLYWGAGATGTYETYNNSWTPEHTDAFYPAYKNAARNRQVQTRYLANGAYLRMKNLALGYTLPQSFTNRIKLQRLRVSASAYNLFEFKSVPKTFDPELLGMDYPIIRSYALGIQATF